MPVAAPPDLRVPYHIDGTVMRVYQTGNIISTATRQELNDDSISTDYRSGTNQDPRIITWTFPQPMTITAFWATFVINGLIGTPTARPWGWSFDTTTGLDGTWTYINGSSAYVGNPSLTMATHGIQGSLSQEPNVRSAPKVLPSPVDNVKGVSLAIAGTGTSDFWLQSAVIYGHVTTPNWLEFWHPTLDQPVTVTEMDWGLHDRGSADVQPFRLKNCNGTYTMTGITLAINDISTDSPQAGATHTLSLDDASYLSSITVGDLTPGEISSTLYVKRTTPSNAVVGIYDLYMKPHFTGLVG